VIVGLATAAAVEVLLSPTAAVEIGLATAAAVEVLLAVFAHRMGLEVGLSPAAAVKVLLSPAAAVEVLLASTAAVKVLILLAHVDSFLASILVRLSSVARHTRRASQPESSRFASMYATDLGSSAPWAHA
jgi:hypothetical protein